MSNERSHRINWFEIPVSNLDAATQLYSAMLGYELKREVLWEIPHAILATANDGVTGTLIEDRRRLPKSRGGTTVFLHAPDGVAACLARAVEAGAKVVSPTTDIAPFGTMALIEDFDGNLVGLHAR